MKYQDRIPVSDEQPQRINIKEVISKRGNINKATKHNVRLLIDRSVRNLPNYD